MIGLSVSDNAASSLRIVSRKSAMIDSVIPETLTVLLMIFCLKIE